MVVSRRWGQLILVRQVDHAELAGVLALHWGNDRFTRPSPHASICLGTSRHDDGWLEPDARPLYNARTKRPLHFPDVDQQEHSRFYRGGIERVIAMDPYAGLLVSMHATGLYRRRWGVQPDLSPTRLTEDVQPVLEAFIVEQEAVQARIKLRILDPGRRRSEFERDLWYHYELLQVWDRLSLFACMTDLRQSAERRFSRSRRPRGGPLGR